MHDGVDGLGVIGGDEIAERGGGGDVVGVVVLFEVLVWHE